MRSNHRQLSVDFRSLEGHRVAVMLADGSQLDDVELISAGRGNVNSLWLNRQGIDVIVKKGEISELHEVTQSAA